MISFFVQYYIYIYTLHTHTYIIKKKKKINIRRNYGQKEKNYFFNMY